MASIGFPLGSQIASYPCGVNASPVNVLVISLIAYIRLISFDRLGHSHIPLSFGWLNLIIPGPAVHQIHHSAELRHRDTNFSQNPPFWDFIFGTYYMPKRGETWRCGLPSSASIAFLTVFLDTCSRREISRTDCRCTKYARLIRPIVSTVVILRLVVSPNSQRT